MKRTFAIILVIALAICMLPIASMAAECKHEKAYQPFGNGAWRCNGCKTWFENDPRPCMHPNMIRIPVGPWGMTKVDCPDCGYASWE